VHAAQHPVVLEYWKLENASPICAETGEHGFLAQNGKVRFADT
jgi:hypothetical protein